MSPAFLTATQAVEAVRSGQVTCEELVKACLDRIAETDADVEAWAYLDPAFALQRAREADDLRKQGKSLGALHGVPIGVKDVFDTFDMPTENGTALHAGRRPPRDAAVVALLREAGAIVLGKTVTTELAVYHPGKTRNPHDPRRTPGGSSSGSAAAVASFMAPLAVGSQTNGSVVRPAAYCGVYGYKPTYGLISRHRALRQSPPLDQVGVFARTIEDAALLAEQLMAFDDRDPAMRPLARPRLTEAAIQDPPVTPRLAFVKSPVWAEAEEDTRGAFEELTEWLGDDVQAADLPERFGEAVTLHRTIMEADLARSFAPEYERGADKLSAKLREMIERGRRCLAIDYNRAVEAIPALNQALEGIFEWHDAILTPATTGVAPVGLDSTGSPVFCTIWTLCGMPSITLPILQGEDGMPMGAQLVGPRGDDARLLRTARWLVARAAAADNG